MEKFDLIVVGAGTGGCIAAKTVAEAGLEVCLIDRKKEDHIGEKICGEAIGKHHFDNLELNYPAGDELEQKIEGVKIFSPNKESVFRVKGEGLHGFIVNRRLFGQRLLRGAVDAGSTLLDSTQAIAPVVKNGFVTGVKVRDLKTNDKIELRSKVVVDASGFSAVLRKKLPLEFGIDANVSNEDVVICYREIRELRKQIVEPDYLEIHLNQTIAPAGYYWIFPKGFTKVNVGLGVGMLNDFPNPKKQLYSRVLSDPLFDGSSFVSGGGGHVPTRRPTECMSGNGILIVGDAACQVNPIHGGGIGPSMMGGFLSGETAIEALNMGDVSQEALWTYNTKYMRTYGAKQAALDVLRLFLQGLGDEYLDYVMKYQVITESDLLKASISGDVHLNITEKTLRVFRGLRKLSFLRRLRIAVSLMKRVKALYQDYPASSKKLNEWKIVMHSLIREVKSELTKK